MIYNFIVSFNSHDDSMRWVLLLSPFFRWECWCPVSRGARIYNLNLTSLSPKVTLFTTLNPYDHEADCSPLWIPADFPFPDTMNLFQITGWNTLQCIINTSVLLCRIWLRLEFYLTWLLLLHSPDSTTLWVSPKRTSWVNHLRTILTSGFTSANIG